LFKKLYLIIIQNDQYVNKDKVDIIYTITQIIDNNQVKKNICELLSIFSTLLSRFNINRYNQEYIINIRKVIYTAFMLKKFNIFIILYTIVSILSPNESDDILKNIILNYPVSNNNIIHIMKDINIFKDIFNNINTDEINNIIKSIIFSKEI
jgi:hypothetical protein